ncbi:hypothetical protein [Burkholderia multivorans]|uniref:hypothetical protein n=1 Tax=Burkholderia multivorans TaxID=87883 RepID=UPI001C2646DE|nr:hypothetical protein [Burkholderia multivorans]MBU9576676.1 hypothetical protein [Burkholderia multivorans]
MTRDAALERKGNLLFPDEGLELVLRGAAAAAIMSNAIGAEALLDFPDAQVGRLFKARLVRAIGVASALNLDLRSVLADDETQCGRIGRRASEPLQLTDCSADNLERYSVVLQGKLLRGSDFCRLLGITEDRLRKRVASGRIFSVEFEAEPYYPAFLLSDLLDHKDFAKVVQRLGDSTGWSKWKFFTTPAESLGGLTPLWALARKRVKPVLKAAENFAQR